LAERFERYQRELGMPPETADVLTAEPAVGAFFEDALAVHDDADVVSSWIVTDLRGLLDGRSIEDLPFTGGALGGLAGLVEAGSVSRRAAKDVLARMVSEGGQPAELVEAMGLSTMSAGALEAAVDDVLARWPAKVEEYRSGKKNLIGMFVGEVMKATGGAADPKTARTLLMERLDS
jgi:Asp-tRNA(Asn)/Glu-tRNA(Gln) amidotransferase B subunit